MGWEYLNADKSLVKSNRMRLRLRRPQGSERQIHGCGTGAGGQESRVGSGPTGSVNWTDIEFQFPPKVLTDGRKGTWVEEDQRGSEPTAEFATSGPREISLAWIYVIDSFEANSETWNIDRVTRNIRALRGYFANIRSRDAKRDALVVLFHMWCIGGDRPISARIRGIDVRYGETMVFPPGGLSDRAFPLRTDITVDMRIWTRGKGVSGSEFGIQDLPNLEDREPPSWY